MSLQDLLDEVEDVIQDRPKARNKSSSSWSSSSSTPASCSTSSSRSKSEIDVLLGLFDDEDTISNSTAVHPRRLSSSRPEEFQTGGGTKKCSHVLIGGGTAKRGHNTAIATQNVCSNLRCNECDFTIVQFPGRRWSEKADYMFFRENVPNENKLRVRMEDDSRSTAYACQCKWLSIDVNTRVDTCRVKWSCAGHS